jgi:hypothetical protein
VTAPFQLAQLLAVYPERRRDGPLKPLARAHADLTARRGDGQQISRRWNQPTHSRGTSNTSPSTRIASGWTPSPWCAPLRGWSMVRGASRSGLRHRVAEHRRREEPSSGTIARRPARPLHAAYRDPQQLVGQPRNLVTVLQLVPPFRIRGPKLLGASPGADQIARHTSNSVRVVAAVHRRE